MKWMIRQLAGESPWGGRPRRPGRRIRFEPLESRRLLAQLSNMPGDGTLRVDVDAYGSFGSDISDFQQIAGDAFFDPFGPTGVRGTTHESAIAVQMAGNSPVFLSCGTVGSNPPIPDPMTGLCPPIVRLTATRVMSEFSTPALPGLYFNLTQEVFELLDMSGMRLGSYLKQDYEINNTTTNPLTIDVFRYYDADLRFNGTIAVDGGGRDISNAGQILVNTDDAVDTLNVNNLTAILSVGDVTQPAAGFFEVDVFDGLLNRITNSQPLDDRVTGDLNNNQVIDTGLGYDVSTALRHRMMFEPNETQFYTTYTFYGDYFVPTEPTGAVLQGMKFEDFNGNGVFEPAQGERGLAGVQIYVDLNNNGQPNVGEPSAVTGSNGNYQIDGLTVGMYTLREVVPNNFQQTFPATGSHMVNITAPDQVISNLDFGNQSTLATVRGMKFADLNGDGQFDSATEYPLGGWTIFSDLDGNGTLSAGEPSAVTRADGTYVFRVNAGMHTIREVQQANWQPTTPPGGQMTVTIAVGQVVAIDFGNDPDPASIQGQKWNDENGNGRQDPGEAGLPGFRIFIDCNGGTLICEDDGMLGPNEPSVVTDANGFYRFSDLPPGSYLLREESMPGWEQTFPPNNGSHSVTVDAGDQITGINFGNRAQDGSVSGIKFQDLNANGVRDPNEPGLPGFFIFVDVDEDGQWGLGEPGATTGEFGNYAIPGLRPGTYILRERPLPGWEQTFPGGGEGHTVTVGPGEILSGFNFGNAQTSDFGDAPAPYPTLLADNGPRHGALAGFRLGGTWDGEADGIVDSQALGDDLSNLDDEDGVVFLTRMAPGQQATVQVTVATGSNSPGYLQAWIDYDGDGSWADTGEQVIKNRLLGTGVHLIPISVPVSARVGETFARFRYANASNLSFTGPANTGEVEDYKVVILDDEPQANDDQYSVIINSVDNVLPVLENDYPSYQAPTNNLFIFDLEGPAFGTATIDDGGTESDPTDDVILYTPPRGFQGTDVFTYTIVDDTDQTSTATVTILVELSPDPIAVDDSLQVPANSPGTVLDVLFNDLPGENGPVSITSFTTPAHGSLVQGTGGVNLRYTPTTGFVGVDQFEYTISDTLGITSTATVTLHVGNNSANEDMSIRLELLNANGNPLPNNQVAVGDIFTLRAYVQDIRQVPTDGVTSPADLGIFSAYFDLLYSAINVSLVEGSISFGPNYTAGRNQQSAVPGLIDELGALQNTGSAPLGPTEQLLAQMSFRAERIGQSRFASDPADILPLHETLFNHPEVPATIDQIRYGFTTVNIVPAPQLAAIQLRVTDLQNRDISTIGLDQDFKLRAFVQDVRPTLVGGVFSAYTDVTFNPSFVSLVQSATNPTGLDFSIGPTFATGGTMFTVGELDEAGAVRNFSAPPQGHDPILLFEVRMHSVATGGVVFRSNAADDPDNEIVLNDSSTGVPSSQVSYGTVSLSVAPLVPPFQNQQNALDVNNDSEVSPMDALLVINKLNTDGSGPLLDQPEGESNTTFYYDVNGNNMLEPGDVLMVINYLNNVNGVQGVGEGEANSLLLPLVDESVNRSSQIDSSNHNESREQDTLVHSVGRWLDAGKRRPDPLRLLSSSDDSAEEEAMDLESLLTAIAADVHEHWNQG